MIPCAAWRYWRSNDPFAASALQCIHCQCEEIPFSAIGDAAYRQLAGGGPSHGHRQHAQKNLVQIAHAVPKISCRTDRQTHIHRMIHAPITILRNRSRRLSNKLLKITCWVRICYYCLKKTMIAIAFNFQSFHVYVRVITMTGTEMLLLSSFYSYKASFKELYDVHQRLFINVWLLCIVNLLIISILLDGPITNSNVAASFRKTILFLVGCLMQWTSCQLMPIKRWFW